VCRAAISTLFGPPPYSNARGKGWHLAVLGGTPRIQPAGFERAAAIC